MRFWIVSLLMAVGPASRAGTIDRIAATVNNEVILQSEVDGFPRTLRLRGEVDPVLGFEDSIKKNPTREKILDFLIQERLILQTFKVSDSEVEQEIQAVMKNAGVTKREQLDQFLKSEPEHFTPKEYDGFIAISLAKRAFIDRELRNRANISEEDVRNEYYNRAKRNASIPLVYKIQLIAIDPSNYDTPKTAQDAAEKSLRSIRQGEPFEEVARRVSDDPSKENGGLLDDYLPAKLLQEPLPSVVKNLQIGKVSEVLKSARGYMIVKLVDAKSTESEQFLAEKESIRQSLAKTEYARQLYLWADRARNDAYVKINGPQ